MKEFEENQQKPLFTFLLAMKRLQKSENASIPVPPKPVQKMISEYVFDSISVKNMLENLNKIKLAQISSTEKEKEFLLVMMRLMIKIHHMISSNKNSSGNFYDDCSKEYAKLIENFNQVFPNINHHSAHYAYYDLIKKAIHLIAQENNGELLTEGEKSRPEIFKEIIIQMKTILEEESAFKKNIKNNKENIKTFIDYVLKHDVGFFDFKTKKDLKFLSEELANIKTKENSFRFIQNLSKIVSNHPIITFMQEKITQQSFLRAPTNEKDQKGLKEQWQLKNPKKSLFSNFSPDNDEGFSSFKKNNKN